MTDRQELKALQELGYVWDDPSEIVDQFEYQLADYFDSPFAVAIDSATHAMELSLRYLEASGAIQVPIHTYPSVPMLVCRLGCEILWKAEEWVGCYRLEPFPVVDAAVDFRPRSYEKSTFTCLSFQKKKALGIGRGGMILLDDEKAYHWLRRARHDGRTPGKIWKNDSIEIVGWHYYMTPEDAARGILLFQEIKNESHASGSWRDYIDLRNLPVFSRKADGTAREIYAEF